MKITVDSSRAELLLRQKQMKLKNLRPAMQSVAIMLQEIVMENFKAEGRPTPWKPLSPVTIAIKKKKHGTLPPMLVDSGTLRRSIHHTHGNDYAKVSTPVTYAKKHQEGLGNVPARPFMVLPQSEVPKLVEVVRRYVK